MEDLKVESIRIERDLGNRDAEGYNKWSVKSKSLGTMYVDGKKTEEEVLEDVFRVYGDNGWNLKQYFEKGKPSGYNPVMSVPTEYQATFKRPYGKNNDTLEVLSKHRCGGCGKCGVKKWDDPVC